MERAAAGRASVADQAPAAGRAQAKRRSQHALIGLQRSAGNRAVQQLVAQRASITIKGGHPVTDVNGPGTNQRADVIAAQGRLVDLDALTPADAATDRATVDAKGKDDPILAADIPRTTAAIPAMEKGNLSEPAAKKVLKADLVAGVGVGEKNDPADVELVLNLLHEESHVANVDYDIGLISLAGTGHTIDIDTLPGFVNGISKLKKGFAGGFPFRGSTAKRKKLLVTEGTADYQKSLDYNHAARQQLKAWLDEAAKQTKDKLLRNSAQWLLSGRVKLFCQTRTHDSAARVKAARQPARFWAIFGGAKGAITEPQSPYVRKLKGEQAFDPDNVKVEAPSGGFQSGSNIGVVDPVNAGKAFFFDTVRHEAQHGADHTPENDVGHYTSEFNARWVEERFKVFSTRRKVKAMGHTWTEKQWAIFQDIWSHNDLYPYLQKNWFDTVAAQRAAWRRMVVGLKVPATFNAINSVRIEDLYLAMTACAVIDCIEDDRFGRGEVPANPKASAVRTAMKALDDLDRTTIKSNTELNQLALTNLFGRLRAEYFAM